MPYTLDELKDLLKNQCDPDELIELFNASSDELVEHYSYLIEDNYERYLNVVLARDISDYHFNLGG